MSITPARALALDVLTRVTADGAWVPQVLDAALRAKPLDERESAFATRLSYGTVEMLATIDEVVLDLAERPGRIRPRVMNALRIAAYELLWLHTPAAVAVDQGVQMVRARDQHAAGFANALLRRLAERADEFPWGDPDTDRFALARLTGFPRAITEYLAEELGEDAASSFMRACADPAPLYVATNLFKTTDDELLRALGAAGAQPELYEPAGCIRCDSPRQALSSEPVLSGSALVCDSSAQLVATLPAALGGGLVVDIGAGRGSKTALIVGAGKRSGCETRVTAVDLYDWKIDTLTTRMEALQIPGVKAAAVDATDADALLAAVADPVDVVLVDAPCSGTGTLRRHPEKRWSLLAEDIVGLTQLQSSLLEASSRLVRPGGFVVYSTCSVLPAENMGVVHAFLGGSQGAQFGIVAVGEYLPPSLRRFVTAEGCFQSMPEPGGPDGHFAVLLRRH